MIVIRYGLRTAFAVVLMSLTVGSASSAPPLPVSFEDIGRVTYVTMGTNTYAFSPWGNLKFYTLKDKETGQTFAEMLDSGTKIDVTDGWATVIIKSETMQKLVAQKFFDDDEARNVVLRHIDKLEAGDIQATFSLKVGLLNKGAVPAERFQALILANVKNAKRLETILGEEAITQALFRVDGEPRGGKLKTLPELVKKVGAVKLAGTGAGKELKLKLILDKQQTFALDSEGYLKSQSDYFEGQATMVLGIAEKMAREPDSKAKAKQRLEYIIQDYPKTKAAVRAKDLLEKLK